MPVGGLKKKWWKSVIKFILFFFLYVTLQAVSDNKALTMAYRCTVASFFLSVNLSCSKLVLFSKSWETCERQIAEIS